MRQYAVLNNVKRINAPQSFDLGQQTDVVTAMLESSVVPRFVFIDTPKQWRNNICFFMRRKCFGALGVGSYHSYSPWFTWHADLTRMECWCSQYTAAQCRCWLRLLRLLPSISALKMSETPVEEAAVEEVPIIEAAVKEAPVIEAMPRLKREGPTGWGIIAGVFGKVWDGSVEWQRAAQWKYVRLAAWARQHRWFFSFFSARNRR